MYVPCRRSSINSSHDGTETYFATINNNNTTGPYLVIYLTFLNVIVTQFDTFRYACIHSAKNANKPRLHMKLKRHGSKCDTIKIKLLASDACNKVHINGT
jgi:hypothetical protein